MNPTAELSETIHWGGMFSLADELQILALTRKTGALEVSHGGQPGRVFFIDGQVVDALHGSRRGTHALLSLLQLSSTHATFTDGQPHPHRTIRESVPELLLEAARQSDESGPRHRPPENAPPARAHVPNPPNAHSPTLLISAADETARLFPLNKPVVNIGRAPDNDIVIADHAVSRHHARIDVRHFAIVVRDLSSRNGTWLRSCRVCEVVLNPDDTVHFGLVAARLVHRDWTSLPQPPPATASASGRRPTQAFDRSDKAPWMHRPAEVFRGPAAPTAPLRPPGGTPASPR